MSLRPGSLLAAHFEPFVPARHRGTLRQSGPAPRGLRSLPAGARPAASPERQHLLDYVAGLARWRERARDNAVCVVWQAWTYALLHGAPVEPLPPRPQPAPTGVRVRPPRLVTLDQVRAILAASRRLPPLETLRPVTAVTRRPALDDRHPHRGHVSVEHTRATQANGVLLEHASRSRGANHQVRTPRRITMTTTTKSFQPSCTDFFERDLAVERNAGRHTIAAYRPAVFPRWAAQARHCTADERTRACEARATSCNGRRKYKHALFATGPPTSAWLL